MVPDDADRHSAYAVSTNSTGLPYPLCANIARHGYPPGARFCLVTVPFVSLLFLGIVGFTLLKMVERSLPTDTPRATPFFVLILLFAVL